MPEVISIDDPDDPRIAPFRDIRERDLVGRRGLFIAEGKVVLAALAASSQHRAQSMLVAKAKLAGAAEALAALPARVPVYVAAPAVMDAIAGFPIHRGVLALGARGPSLDAGDLLAGLPAKATVLILIGLSNHDNVGAVFRNAAAFGAGAVLLDSACCDPLYRKAIRVSVGTVLTVPFARFEGDPIELAAAHGFRALALSPAGTLKLTQLRAPARTALVLGAEGAGLPATLLGRIPTVAIEMRPGLDSLNVATASGIALHHLMVGRRRPRRSPSPRGGARVAPFRRQIGTTP